MGYKTHNDGVNEMLVNGTSLQGHIDVDYATLCELFGEPSENYDDYKSDAEWVVQFDDGTVATIYNYKNGRNYCGPSAPAREDITEWNIGGKSKLAAQLVREEVECY
jgi:hypothetical protein